ncbi:MAG TPA: hypothetical protein VMC79_13750 [Rectinemataceae bacterium]|nr:hypothetical protein [Rectinemataceae bacterium]
MNLVGNRGRVPGPSPSRDAPQRPSAAPSAIPLAVLDNREVGPGIFLLRIRRAWDFEPGQVLGLSLDPAVPARLYSIASGIDEDFYEILYNRVQGGLLTPRLATLVRGETVTVSPPSGTFRGSAGPALWIATGTGIAPFVSMARSRLAEDKLLLHGARGPEYFYQIEYFSALLQERYVACCSRRGTGFGFQGRVSDWIASRESFPQDRPCLLCGSAEMVVGVRDLLLGKGLPFSSISGEIYF